MKQFMQFSIIAIICTSLFACGPSIKTIVKMRPIAEYDDYSVSEKDQAITLTKEDIKMTLIYQDADKLESYSKSISINPYMTENKVLFTVFLLTIENKRDDRIIWEPGKCVILDGIGNQFNGFTIDSFKNMYPSTSAQYYTYSPIFDEYTPRTAYTEEYYKRKTAEETMIKGGDVYSAVKSKGLLVFEKVSREASQISLIIPAVVLYKDNQIVNKIDFKFKFSQEVRLIRQ
ncbi:MAG: hypothetical protein AABY84_12410 [Candidatus Firestonebacteria bacterium]|mgnify:CR=1 FL=1